jgi:hypothetical protein
MGRIIEQEVRVCSGAESDDLLIDLVARIAAKEFLKWGENGPSQQETQPVSAFADCSKQKSL